jgi:hypothetical protein
LYKKIFLGGELMKKKVLLASAILASSIGLTSCGGGGGGDSAPASTSTTQPPPPPPPPPAPTEVGKVLALGVTGFVKGDTKYELYESSIKSDGTFQWARVDTSSVNIDLSKLEYVYEFNNNAVLLTDNNNTLYCYYNQKITKTNPEISDTMQVGLGNLLLTSTGKAVFNDCNVVETSGNLVYAGKNYVLLDDGAKSTVLKADKTYYNINDTGLKVLNRVEDEKDTIVVTSSNKNLYLIKKDGTVVQVLNSSSDADGNGKISNAQVVKVGTDYYVAAYDGDNNKIYYAKNLTKPSGGPFAGNGNTSYALDKNGNLYYSDGSKTYRRLIDTVSAITYNGISGATKIIPLGDAALAYDGSNYYLLPSDSSTAVAVTLSTDVANAFDVCSTGYSKDPSDPPMKYASIYTEYVLGKGTNVLMCTNGSKFAYLKYDSTNKKFSGFMVDNGTLQYKLATQNSMIFVNTTNKKALTTCTATAGCSSTSTDKAFDPGLAIKTADNLLDKAGTIYYLKAAYATTGSAPYIVDLGQGTTDTSTLNILFSSTETPTGGNVSLDLNKVANLYSPVNSQCQLLNTAYYDNVTYKNPSLNPTTKDLNKQNTCFIRVLQVR